MQCLRPIAAGYDQQTGAFSLSHKHLKSLEHIKIPCRKCISCRLNTAREKAVRCIHESQFAEDSIFLTLTYDEENVTERLDYTHFQKFIRKIRDNSIKDVSYVVTGEYGEQTKRPHWHAIIFDYYPSDPVKKYQTDAGDQVFESEEIDKIWDMGITEFGSVSIDSAGYVCRYAAKKLVHGKDQEHDYHPIHNTSKKYPIGKRWIEKYCDHTFQNGFIVLPNGKESCIPRYYKDWCKKENPDLYKHYQEKVLPKIKDKMEAIQRKEELEWHSLNYSRIDQDWSGPRLKPRNTVRETVLKSKFKKLQENLKL